MTFETPSLARRAGSIVYEALLLLGVLAFAEIPVLIVNQLVPDIYPVLGHYAHQVWLFLVLGCYFVLFWHLGGQTLAMKTWRIKLVVANGAQASYARSILRYVLSWTWFLPGMILLYALGLKGWASVGLIPLGMLIWAATIWLNPERQFLHDKLAGTRLVHFAGPATRSPPPNK